MKIRDRQSFLAHRDRVMESGKDIPVTKLLIGYGTCGIAAGADEIYRALKAAIDNGDLKGIELVKVGCVGSCHAEPTVELRYPDGSSVLLGYLHANTVPEVIYGYITTGKKTGKHVLEKNWQDI